MEHPLRMDAEAMRRAGYATVDALVARLADPAADPVLRRASPAQMRARLAGPPPEQPGDYAAVLERLLADVLPYASRTDHPGYFAFVPSFTTWPAALAELAAAAANPYCGAWMESAGAGAGRARGHRLVPHLARAAGGHGRRAGHRRLGGQPHRAARRPGRGGRTVRGRGRVRVRPGPFLPGPDRAGDGPAPPTRCGCCPPTARWRLRPGAVTAAVRADRDAGRVPFALCASGGSTNTGAVDPLAGLADVCAAEGLWLHVDAAYGGFAALVPKGAVAAGRHRPGRLGDPGPAQMAVPADGMRQRPDPRRGPAGADVRHPPRLPGRQRRPRRGEVNFADRGLQLSRGFRALKVWVSVQTFGLAAFRASVQRGLDLAEYAETLVREHGRS